MTIRIVDIELSIPLDTVCYIILRSREFEVSGDQPIGEEPEPGETFPSRNRDPVYLELRNFINELNEDEQIDLVALAWMGRGDGGITDWDDLREEAASAHNRRTGQYLLGMPLLPDYLEEALSALDHSCEEVEEDRH